MIFLMYFDKLLSVKVVPIYFPTSFLLDIPFPQMLSDTIIVFETLQIWSVEHDISLLP